MAQSEFPEVRSVPRRAAGVGLAATLPGRALLAALVAAYFVLGVSAVTLATRGRATHELWTPLDRAIPFVPWTVYVYSWAYTLGLYPLFVVRCPRLFRRVAAAFATTLTASFACFLAFPVTSRGLRGDVAPLSDAVFHDWGMKLTYAVDPPTNLFPSMHASLAIASVAAAFRAERRLGWLAAPLALGIVLTITTTKQHFVADGAAALVLGALVDRATLAGYEAERAPLAERSYGLRGAALYLAFHAAVYAGLWVACRAGWRPW